MIGGRAGLGAALPAGARRVMLVALCGLVAAILPTHIRPAWAGPGGAWDGNRAELFIVNVSSPSIVPGGPAGALTATLVNRGPSTATNVRFTYQVPAGLTFAGASLAGGSCSFVEPTVICTRASLLNGASAAITINLSAPLATTIGAKEGSFNPPVSDQFNPAGGNILMETRTENWVTGVEGDRLPPIWPPSDPYSGPPPPCFPIVDSLFRLHECRDSVVTRTVQTAEFGDDCLGLFEKCLRTWEMIGTYYAQESGQIRLCAEDIDDGAYVNWSNGYDPAVSSGPTGFYTSQADMDNDHEPWISDTWRVTAGQAYRFSIRIANRDTFFFRGRGEGGTSDFGFSQVNGSAATCAYENFFPSVPGNINVVRSTATIRLSKELGTPRIRAVDQFTVQLKDPLGRVVNSTDRSTTGGSGTSVTFGTGTTGQTTVIPGTAYTLTEIAAGTTVLSEYNQSIACTNAAIGSPTTLPSGPFNPGSPPTITPAQGDTIFCTLTNAGIAPTVTILKGTDGGDATFTFTVTGGPLPLKPTITTSGGTGSVVLSNTQIGQSLNVYEDALAGWSESTQLCVNQRTGAVVNLTYTLKAADQIVCSFANRAVPPPPQACVTNPVANPNFATGGTSWATTGSWSVTSGRMSNFADHATLLTDRVTQTIGAVAPGSLLSFDVAVADGSGGQGGNAATLQIFYGGTQYASIVTTPAAAGFGGTATVSGVNGATVTPATIPMGAVRNIAITLPGGVPRTGDLQYRFAVTGSGDTLGVGDDIGFTGVSLRTTAICLQKRSAAGFSTFGFTTTNLDTNTATPPAGTAFSITTSVGNNPATVNPAFGRTGTQLVVVAPGNAVTLTETGPEGWTPSSVSCTDARTGAAVSGVSLTGATVTIAGAAIPAQTVLNCLLTDGALTFTATKTASPAVASPGATVTYTVTVRNTSATAYPGASISDDLTGILDDAVFGSVTATAGTATYSAPILEWTGDLPAGGSATITYTVTVNSPDLGNHRLSNVLTTESTGGNCGTQAPRAECTVDTPVADSRVLKSSDRSTIAPGETVTYTTQVANIGAAPLAGASFADDLSGILDDATFISATATIGTATFTSPTLNWSGDIPVGTTATVTYTVRVNDPDLGDHTLGNVIVSSTLGSNCGAGSTDPNCRTGTGVTGLRIVKSADHTVAAPGEAVAYTVTVTNIGQTTQTGTLFTDNLADVLDDATVDLVTASTGSAQLSGSELVYGATLAPGAVATVTYRATVRRPDPGNHSLANAVSSAAPGATCPAGTNGSVCALTVPIVGLHLQKSASVAESAVGGTVTYTTTVTNTGQAAVTGAGFTDDLTGVVDDAVVGTPTASSGTVTLAPTELTWTGDVAVGATVTVTYTVTVNRPATGDHRLRNLISSTTPGTDCPGTGVLPRPGCLTDTPIADLRITKTPGAAVAAPGEQFSYTVLVENVGQTSYSSLTGVDDLTGVLDDADLISVSASGGTVEFQSPRLIWSSILPVGASGSATYTVQPRRPSTGDHHLINSMSSDAPGSMCPGDPTCITDTPVADLEATKAVDVTQAVPGQIVTYTVSVRNAGAVPLENLSGIDDVSGVLDDATFLDATASGGTVEFDSPRLIWTGSGVPLPVGGTATVTYRFQVNSPDTGDHRLINALSSTNLGVSCPGGPACVTDTPVAELTIEKAADVATVDPGDTVRYTTTVTNNGQVPFTGATFTDDLSNVVDDAAVGNIAATVGAAALTGSTLTWTGDLAPGASAVVTYEATVNVPDMGNRVLINAVTSATPGSSCPTAAGPGCSTTTAVPAFEISKVADRATANRGDTVTYTVTLANLGQADITGATVTDDLSGVEDDATFGTLTQPSIGTAVVGGPPLDITWTGTLLVGQSTSFTYTVTVNPSGGDSLLTDTVSTLTTGSNCPPLSTDPRCASTTLVNGLSIRKTTDHATALPGDTVSHTVTVTNTGQTALTGATFTDNLTAVLDDATFGALTPPSLGSAVFDAGPPPTVTWTGDLGPGQSTTVTYTVTVNRPGTGDRLMTNRVSSSTPGTDCPPAATNPACVAVTRVTELRIVKTPSVASAAPGDAVSYTVVVSNVGTNPISAARFTDSLTGVLDDATYVSASATGGSVTFIAPTLTWTGSLAVGASVTVQYTLRVRDPDPGDAMLHNTVSSTTPGTDCAACVTDTPIARLSIAKTVSSPAALPGDTLTYTVVVTNTGQVTMAADFTDDLTGLLDDATFGTVSATSGTADFTDPDVTWSGTLTAGGGTATITYSVTVNDPATGDRLLVNAVTSTTAGDNCPCGTQTPVGGLTITKSASRASVGVGEAITYTILVQNVGQVPLTGATFTDDLTGIVDDALVDNIIATSGSAALVGSAITWTGDLAVGSFAAIAYRATVIKPGVGDHELTNTVASPTAGNNCQAGSTDPDCVTTTPIGEIAIVKTASPSPGVPGQSVTYTVTVENIGQTVQTGATFDDDLTGVLDDATVGGLTADVGTVTFSAPTLTWTGNLAIGQTATVSYTAAITSPATGDHLLHNAVTSATAGANCPGASTCSADVPVSDVQVTKTVNRTSTLPGATVTYTVTIANSGQFALTGATLADDLTGVLDDATAGTASATTGSAAFAGSSLTWTGDLPIGATATITYSVVVKQSGLGDRQLTNLVAAPLPGSNCTPASSDPVQCATSTPVAQLQITKVAAPASTVPNGTVTYTVTVTNTGNVVQAGLLFTDDLTDVLDDAAFGSVTATVGNASFTSPMLSLAATLAPGAASTVTYTVQTRVAGLGSLRLVNRLTSTAMGATCSAGAPCVTDTPVSRLAIVKTADRVQAVAGQQVTYTASLVNAGQTVLTGATFTDDLTGVLDDAAFGTASATVGSVTFTTPNLVWTGDLGVGASATVTYTVTVQSPDPGDHRLVNTLTSPTPGNTCPSTQPCQTDTPVAELTIVKQPDRTAATLGSPVIYTVTVLNAGQTPYVGATFTDNLSGVLDDAAFGTVSASSGTATFTSPLVTWTGDLAVGASATITYAVSVNRAANDYRLNNSITSTSAGADCPPAIPCVTSTPVGNLSIVKTATPATVAAGDTVTYQLQVSNSGQLSYTQVTIDDNLSGALDDATFAGASATSGSVVFTSPTLTWTGDLIPSGSVTITYTMTVAVSPTGDHILANSVTSTAVGSNCTQTVPCLTATPVAEMLILKEASSETVPDNGVVEYTITVTNHGQTPLIGASLTEDLTGLLDDARISQPSSTLGSVVITAPGFVWTGILPIGATAVITYSAIVDPLRAGDNLLVSTTTSTTPGSTCTPAAPCSTTTAVTSLTIDKTVDRAVANVGERVFYTIDVTNTGQTPITDIVLRDDLSGVLDDAVPGTANANRGTTPVFQSSVLVWQGDLNIGESVRVTYSVVVNRPDTGDHRLRNAAASSTPGSNCTIDRPCTTDTPIRELRVVKAVSDSAGLQAVDLPQVTPGQEVRYAFVVTNVGQVAEPAASVTDDITGLLDDATLLSTNATRGTVTVSLPNLVWTGPLGVNEQATITYLVRINNPDNGDHLVSDQITATSPLSSCPEAAGCRMQTPVAELSIVKAVDRLTASGGDVVTFTVTVTNLGRTDLIAATFSDDLTGVLDDAEFRMVTSANATFNAPYLTWTGDLPAGAAPVTVTYTVLVDRPSTGDHQLTNSVTSRTPGTGCVPATPCATSTTVAEWTILKSATPSTLPAELGGTVAYTVTLTNTGREDILGVTFTDDLTGVLDDATVDPADVGTTGGTAVRAAQSLVWTGDLPLGSPPVTVTYLARIDNPVGGDQLLTNVITSSSPSLVVRAPVFGIAGVCLVCTTTTPIGGLVIEKLIDRSPAAVADVVTYTMRVSNTGQATYLPATVTDDLTGVLDDATFVSAAATTGSATFAPPSLVWQGVLPVGATVTVIYQLRVNNPGTGDHRLINAVSSADGGSPCPGAATCTTETPVAELSIRKRADRVTADAGDSVVYTVDVINAGLVDLPGSRFVDDLTQVLDDGTPGSVSATSGTVTLSPPSITWDGDLPIGASARVTYSVSINEPATGDGILLNTVASAELGSGCPISLTALGSDDAPRLAQAVAAVGCVVIVTLPGEPEVPPGAGPGQLLPITGRPLAKFVLFAVLVLVLGSLLVWWARGRRAGTGAAAADRDGGSMRSVVLAAAIVGLSGGGPAGFIPSPPPAMAISVTNGVASAVEGDELTYTISLRNDGTEGSGPLGVTFQPPTGVELLSLDHEGTRDSGVAKWSVDVAARQTMTLTVVTKVGTTPAGVNGLAGIACIVHGGAASLCATDMDQIPGRDAIQAVVKPAEPASGGVRPWQAVAVALAMATVSGVGGYFLVRHWLRRRARPRRAGPAPASPEPAHATGPGDGQSG